MTLYINGTPIPTFLPEDGGPHVNGVRIDRIFTREPGDPEGTYRLVWEREFEATEGNGFIRIGESPYWRMRQRGDVTEGPYALNESINALGTTQWYGWIEDNKVKLSGPGVESLTLVEHDKDIDELSITFDMLGNPISCYHDVAGDTFIRWYNLQINDYDITVIPGLITPYARQIHFDVTESGSEILLVYVSEAGLCYRRQSDRYLIEYPLGIPNAQVVLNVGNSVYQELVVVYWDSEDGIQTISTESLGYVINETIPTPLVVGEISELEVRDPVIRVTENTYVDQIKPHGELGGLDHTTIPVHRLTYETNIDTILPYGELGDISLESTLTRLPVMDQIDLAGFEYTPVTGELTTYNAVNRATLEDQIDLAGFEYKLNYASLEFPS